MMRPAFLMRAAWMTLRPMPPTPNTATSWPGWTLARLSTAPAPVMTPQPMRQAEVSGTLSSIFTTWRELTTVYSAKAELAANW